MENQIQAKAVASSRSWDWSTGIRDAVLSRSQITATSQQRVALGILIGLRVLILSALLGLSAWAEISHGFHYPREVYFLIALPYALSVVNAWWIMVTPRVTVAAYVQMIFDVILSTIALAISGSAYCLVFFFVLILAAAVALHSRGAVVVAGLSALCYAAAMSGLLPFVKPQILHLTTHDIFILYFGLVMFGLGASYIARQYHLLEKLIVIHKRNLDDITRQQLQLFNDLVEGIVTLNKNGEIISMNTAAEELLTQGRENRSQLIGGHFFTVLHNAGVEEAHDLESQNKSLSGTCEFQLQQHDGKLHINCAFRPLLDASGEETGTLAILSDVSHVKSLERRLSLHEKMTRLLADGPEAHPVVETELGGIYIIGESPVMKHILTLVSRVAKSDASVLLSGESGTGKELIARSIHTQSHRASAPFVAVNCGAIPEALIESELFGHKKGSFTGAYEDTSGLFLQADGGTIFLDEIGELSPKLQTKLLRVLQEKSIRPVGGSKDTLIDIRVVAATNRNLKADILEGRFREDLYYRLNVVNVVLPPLRDRREDIPLLVHYFMKQLSPTPGELPQISPEALDLLMEYDFPGNIRELENIIERAIVLGGRAILPTHLPQDFQKYPKSFKSLSRQNGQPTEETVIETLPVDLEHILSDIEQRFLLQALEQSGGLKKQAAKLLGLNFRSFRYRLKKYDLSENEIDTTNNK